MSNNAPITFDGYRLLVNRKPVANPDTLIAILKKYGSEPPKQVTQTYICGLKWVNDGDQIWITGDDQKTHIPYNSKCSCGVPIDTHGTCCGWRNAKTTCDPKSLRIVDDRHPYYNRNFNDWINSQNFLTGEELKPPHQ